MHALVLGMVMQAFSVSEGAQERMLADLNATRAHAGLRLLRLDNRLSRVALEHAIEMANAGYFDHDSGDGSTPFERMRRAGCAYDWAGENLALSPDEPAAYRALLASPGHLENILQPHFSKVGLSAVREADGDMLFVQDFTD
ncbi:MAG: CAP domain-containing protein [Candidatus Baltobacteraceae bacterium]